MLTVALHDVRLQAFIGLYPQEMKTGNLLSFNIDVQVDAAIDNLPMIDYEWLYSIIKSSVAKPAALLEDVVKIIYSEIIHRHPEAKISIAIKKLSPPLGGEVAAAVVAYQNY